MDIQHFYIEAGSIQNFPLILLHGNGEDSTYFKNQIAEFSKKFHVFAIDTRGHGKTPKGTAPFSIKQFAEDLFDFFKEKKIEKADILGFSDGGNIALIFALKHPEMVNKLVLNGANLNPKGVKRSVQIPVEAGYRVAKFFSKFSADAKNKADLLGLMVNEPDIKPEELASVKIPVLVIAGTNDMILEKHTKLIAEKLPHASLIFINGSHFIANENFTEFNFAVMQFLEN